MKEHLAEDIALLQRIMEKDASAFRQLFDLYWTLLYRLAASKTADSQDAEDMVQEVFISLWQKKEPITLTTHLKGYLIACIYLKIFQHFRKKGLHQKHYEDFARYEQQLQLSPAMPALEEESFEEVYGKLQEVMEQAIAMMPPQMQTVFSLKHYQGMTVNEIAAQLHISPESVKTHLKLGMGRLRKAGAQYPGSTLLLPIFFTILESSH